MHALHVLDVPVYAYT